ncbi:MAG: hypothetical protein QY317_16230 [Candidatus Jettenia caeni]|nr:MAG: hypothetical protein QY317_16230 [Candidatus Jettenia caeni]
MKAEFEEIKTKKPLPKHLRKPFSRMNDEELEEVRSIRGYKHGWVWHMKKSRIPRG